MLRFCSYSCEVSDNNKAQTKACLTDSSVYCTILDESFNKGYPCQVEDESFEEYISKTTKLGKKRDK